MHHAECLETLGQSKEDAQTRAGDILQFFSIADHLVYVYHFIQLAVYQSTGFCRRGCV